MDQKLLNGIKPEHKPAAQAESTRPEEESAAQAEPTRPEEEPATIKIDGKGLGKLYQDQIYGPKVLTPLAFKLIDTPEFQRLAGIKQLGFANATYRGAEHTRFTHSIGTYFISRTIMRRIVQNHERLGLEHPGKHLSDRFRLIPTGSYPPGTDIEHLPVSHQSKWRGLTEVVSIAALLHDITHVPFGHTLEDEFTGIFTDMTK